MRGRFLVEQASNEPAGSCFIGTVKSGSLRRGMEALCDTGVVAIRSLENPESREQLEKAARGYRAVIYCEPTLPHPEKLVGSLLIFEDKKTAPLRKAILLKPELG